MTKKSIHPMRCHLIYMQDRLLVGLTGSQLLLVVRKSPLFHVYHVQRWRKCYLTCALVLLAMPCLQNLSYFTRSRNRIATSRSAAATASHLNAASSVFLLLRHPRPGWSDLIPLPKAVMIVSSAVQLVFALRLLNLCTKLMFRLFPGNSRTICRSLVGFSCYP